MTFLRLLLFFLPMGLLAQKPCDFSVNVTDSTGHYKTTREFMMYEKNFAGNAAYLFSAIVVNDNLPSFMLQLIEKSGSFVKVRCFDPNSKIFLQLENGKIVTLIHQNDENCGSSVREESGQMSRVLTGYFYFRKDDVAALKSSPISLMRVKFGSETQDYIIKNAFKAELDQKLYNPATYFMDYYHCIDDLK